jgi:hypothetical protein
MHGPVNVKFPGELHYWDRSNKFNKIDNLEYLIMGEGVYYY